MARFFSPHDAPRDARDTPLSDAALDHLPSDFRRQGAAPPALFWRSQPRWQRWLSAAWRWLWDLDEPELSDVQPTPLNRVRAEFRNALWDLQSARADQVREQIERARSLRELWHLRADVFKAIAVHRGQIEAQLRIDHLDDHFPVRSFKHGNTRHAHVTTW
ncbi:hypothetical protein WNB94_00870 [Aquabacterium sp. A3]|uniref:hypothetical protein n=1 Tax=Aquabacterium sp. A3 TaxID=3132829 RepID=UPI00311936EF